MFCEACQADVAAEISPDGKALLCTTCGGEVKRTNAPTLSSEAQSARDLLERWSRDELLDPDQPPESATENLQLPGSTPAPKPPQSKIRVDSATAGPPTPASRRRPADKPKPPESTSGPHFRIDSGHAPRMDDAENTAPPKIPSQFAVPPDDHHEPHYARAAGRGPTQRPAEPLVAQIPAGYRVDEPQAAVRAPHFSTESFGQPTGPRPGRFESLAGQLLAYGGVALLTVGTALVLYGYFGGGEQMTANGWLVATIGQMLLFLGVVTLISGGMQQTTHEVGSRVQYLGERLIRLESSQQTLRGPHFDRAPSNVSAAVMAAQSPSSAAVPRHESHQRRDDDHST